MTAPKNGRLSRTLVNRLWARLLGRGLVEPLDDMDQPAWSRDLLDWLAEDFVAHGYDVKHTLETIMTSRAYALPAVEAPREKEEYVFRGPLDAAADCRAVFRRASVTLTGDWAALPSSLEFDFTGGGVEGDFKLPQWIWTDEPLAHGCAADRLALAAEKPRRRGRGEGRRGAEAPIDRGAPESRRRADRRPRSRPRATHAADSGAAGPLGPHAETDRHKVVFRKTLHLARSAARVLTPRILASQSFEVQVNGSDAQTQDGRRLPQRPHRASTISRPCCKRAKTSSRSTSTATPRKQMNDTERKQFPGSPQHLNQQPAASPSTSACRGGKGDAEIVTDRHLARPPRAGGPLGRSEALPMPTGPPRTPLARRRGAGR